VCGRYAASKNPDELVEEFEVDQPPAEVLQADYNIAPTRKVYAVLEREPKTDGETASVEPVRLLKVVRWGLVPSWAKDISIGAKLNNARSETAAEKPSFKRALARRRCLVPADGYYEWYTSEAKGPGAKPSKQPFYIHPADGSTMAMAGLYELWRNPEKADDDPEAWLWSMCVLTTSATDEFGHIHDRMPMTVRRNEWAAWLDPSLTDLGVAQGLLHPLADLGLEAYPVAPAVNSVRNNGPELLTPLVFAESAPGAADTEPSAGEQQELFPR
jgi:putative SOS response-associated peptidase YedK